MILISESELRRRIKRTKSIPKIGAVLHMQFVNIGSKLLINIL